MRRECHRRVVHRPVLRAGDEDRHDLPGPAIEAHDGPVPAAREDDVGVLRIGREIAELEPTRRVPVAKIDRAVIAAVRDRDGSAVLLRGEHVIGKPAIGDHVVELPGRLVVPAAPRHAAVDAHDRALIDSGKKAPRVVRVDPQQLKIVAARRAGEGVECPATVLRSIERRLRDVDHVRQARVGDDADRNDARIVGGARPRLSAIF